MNIQLCLEKGDIPKYSYGEIQSIIKNTVDDNGKGKYLVITMEEIAELINVISKNVDNDYNKNENLALHTAEEIADVYICIDILKYIFGLNNMKYENVIHMNTLDMIIALSECQQNISKLYRYNKITDMKIQKLIHTLSMMHCVCENCMNIFGVHSDMIMAIKMIKYKRINDRIGNYSKY